MKAFDACEQRAIAKVAAKLPAENFTFPAEELPEFIKWILADFAQAMRDEINTSIPY